VALPNTNSVVEIDLRAIRRRAVRVCNAARRDRLGNRVPLPEIVAEPPRLPDQRCPPPSRRARRADMSRAMFLGLVAGWVGALVVLLIVIAAIRMVG
jgi:hypothetical protein